MQQYIKIFFLEQDRKIIAYVLNRVTQGTSSPNFHFLYPNSSSLPFSTGGNQGGEGREGPDPVLFLVMYTKNSILHVMNMKEKTDFKSIFLCTKSKRNLNVFMRGQNKLSGQI